jgi:lysine-N-methylase
MEIENGRCPMWRQDGLCRIQAELGHEALCQVCRDFPRLRHDYGSLVEIGLELSCPEAARLILDCEKDEVTVTQLPGGEDPEDPEALEILRRSREEALAFLESKAFPLPQTLAILLMYGHDVQGELDGAETVSFIPKELLAEAAKYAQAGSVDPMFHFYSSLEILTEPWQELLAHPNGAPAWSEVLRRFVRYMIRRYWLQAVSDYDLICRVKFIISACLLLAHLPGNPAQNAQLFSKEIENDPDNVDALLDAAYTSPAFTDTQLLGLLVL